MKYSRIVTISIACCFSLNASSDVAINVHAPRTGTNSDVDISSMHATGTDWDAFSAHQLQDTIGHLFPGCDVKASLAGERAVWIEDGMVVDATVAAHLIGVQVYLKKGADVQASLIDARAVFIEDGMIVDATVAAIK